MSKFGPQNSSSPIAARYRSARSASTRSIVREADSSRPVTRHSTSERPLGSFWRFICDHALYGLWAARSLVETNVQLAPETVPRWEATRISPGQLAFFLFA